MRLLRIQGLGLSHSRARRLWVGDHECAASRAGQIWISERFWRWWKDSILVCADADLDAAVDGVTASAFGFSGQKCSACSRAIVEAPIYDEFVERLRERVARLTVGDPAANHNMGR